MVVAFILNKKNLYHRLARTQSEDPQRRRRRKGRGRPGRRRRRVTRRRRGPRRVVEDRDDGSDVVPEELGGEREEVVVSDLETGLEEDEGIDVGGDEGVGTHDDGVAALVIGEGEGIQEAGDVVQGDEESLEGGTNAEDEQSMTLPDICPANALL